MDTQALKSQANDALVDEDFELALDLLDKVSQRSLFKLFVSQTNVNTVSL